MRDHGPQARVGRAGQLQHLVGHPRPGIAAPDRHQALELHAGDVAAAAVQVEGDHPELVRGGVVEVPGASEPPPRQRDLHAGVAQRGGLLRALLHRRVGLLGLEDLVERRGELEQDEHPQLALGLVAEHLVNQLEPQRRTVGSPGGDDPDQQHLDQQGRITAGAGDLDRLRADPVGDRAVPAVEVLHLQRRQQPRPLGIRHVLRGLGEHLDERVVLDTVLAPGPHPGTVVDRGRARHQVPPTELAPDAHGLLDRDPALDGACHPEQGGCCAALGLDHGDGVGRCVGLDEPPEVERLGVGVPRGRHLRGTLQPVAGPLGMVAAQRSREMGVVGDGGAGVGVVGPHMGPALLDEPAGLVVQPHPAGGAQLGVQRLTRERVHERVALRAFFHESAGHREVELVEAVVHRRAGQPGEEVRVDGVAEHGRRGECAHCVVRQPSGSAGGARRGFRRAPVARRGRGGRDRGCPRALGRTAGRRRGCRPSRPRRRRRDADRASPPSRPAGGRRRWCRVRRAGPARPPHVPGQPSCRRGPRSSRPRSYAACRRSPPGPAGRTRPRVATAAATRRRPSGCPRARAAVAGSPPAARPVARPRRTCAARCRFPRPGS